MGLLSTRRGRPRLCRACGNLVGAEADDCSYCGAKDRFTTGLLRNPAVLFGAFGPTRAIGVFIVAYYAIMVLADRLFVVPSSDEMDAYRSFVRFGYTPETLVRFGSLFPPLVDAGEWWRFVTPLFIHLGIIHLAFNTLALFQLGPFVEELYGRGKLLAIFFSSGIVSLVGMYAFGQGGAGASGGLFGLIGSLIAYGVRMPTQFGQTVKSQAIQWAIYGVIMSVFFRASNTAHVSGLIAGFVAAYALSPDEPRTDGERLVVGSIVWAAFLAVAVSFAMMAAQLGRPLA
jgi:membrane associated rhomboid family serine protease